MRRLALSAGIVAASAAYVGWVEAGHDGGPARFVDRLTLRSQAPETAPAIPDDPATTAAYVAPAAPFAPPAAGPAVHRLHDGTYAGQAYYVIYGIIQVRLWITDGKVVAVDNPYYPSERYVSAQISYNILPVLQTEVVQAQQANVDIISGATLTTTGYRLSLQDAFRQAEQVGG